MNEPKKDDIFLTAAGKTGKFSGTCVGINLEKVNYHVEFDDNTFMWVELKNICQEVKVDGSYLWKKIPVKTIKRTLVIKDCTDDFGLGTGVIGIETIEYEDSKGAGFDNPRFYEHLLQDERKFVDSVIAVRTEEIT
jgi:hypothetical protein